MLCSITMHNANATIKRTIFKSSLNRRTFNLQLGEAHDGEIWNEILENFPFK